MANYTKEKTDWLIENAPSAKSYKELTEGFNVVFHETKSIGAIYQKITKDLHINIASDKKANWYSAEEKQWLVENHPLYNDYNTITATFNTMFHKNKTVSSIRELCGKRLNLKSKSGIGGTTKFKPGNRKDQLPIGTIRKNKNGSTYIKVQDAYLALVSGYREPYWKPLQKKIYEDAYGEIPKGKMVIFLDCDRTNFDLSNLYCIDRRISAVLAKNQWYTCDRELTLTAIKWCELYFDLKNKK